MLDEIAFCVVSHERPPSARRLISSIREFYPDADIFVEDDSANPGGGEPYEGATEIQPNAFDIGVSAKRNDLVQHAEDQGYKYVMVLEDDFVFTEHTDVSMFYDLLEAKPELGVAGGACCYGRPGSEYPHNGVQRTWFEGLQWFDGPVQKIKPAEEIHEIRVDGRKIRYNIVHYLPNFILARPETLLACPWDEELKIAGEHIEHLSRLSAVRGNSNSPLRTWRDENARDRYENMLYGNLTNDVVDGKRKMWAATGFRNKEHLSHRHDNYVGRGEIFEADADYCDEVQEKGLAKPSVNSGDETPMPIPETRMLEDVALGVALVPDLTIGHDRYQPERYREQRYRDHIGIQKKKMGIYQRDHVEPRWMEYPWGEPDWEEVEEGPPLDPESML